MQKLSIGVLVLLVLFLAALNVRLQRQGRQLEERLARTENTFGQMLAPRVAAAEALEAVEAGVERSKVTPPPAPVAVPVVPGKDAVQVPAAAATPAAEPLNLAGKSVTFTLDGDNHATLVRVGTDEDLGLTPVQKKLVDDLRKNRDQQVQGYSDLIQRIDAQTEESVRAVLTSEQRAKYDAQHPSEDTATVFEAPPEPKTSLGLRQGYLGIAGADAEGGGARVMQVLPNTPAAAFGLQKDDVILELNGQAVPQLAGLTERIREVGEGLPVVLRIRRGANEFTQSVQLGAVPK